MGPTASGKTPLAEALASELDAQLINADAFQIYRGMDLGTAKPLNKGRYALLDIRDPNERFGVGEWAQLAARVAKSSWDQHQNVVVVGGAGFYIRALFEGYDDLKPPPDQELRRKLDERISIDGLSSLMKELNLLDPKAAGAVDASNPARVRRALERALSKSEPLEIGLPLFRMIKFALNPGIEELGRRIETRTCQMMQNGWTQEVQTLREKGYMPEDPGFRALGYRQMWQVLEGSMSLEGAAAATIVATRQYAKRQRTWLRSEPRLVMLPFESTSDALDRAITALRADS